jgi:hypothetical protein
MKHVEKENSCSCFVGLLYNQVQWNFKLMSLDFRFSIIWFCFVDPKTGTSKIFFDSVFECTALKRNLKWKFHCMSKYD